MSELTKEWLRKTIAELEEERDATPGAVNEDAAMALEAMKLALASLEAKPVAWTDEQELRDVEKFGCAYLFTVNPITPNADQRRVIKLYTAPPAPVSVPDEDLLHMAASAIEDLLCNKDRSGAGVWTDVPAKLRRAAMLQGADGNSPVIPDGWVACSERMPPPKTGVIVGCWFGRNWATKWATYLPYHPDAHQSGFLMPGGSWTPTHWMPLPAAPQQEVK